MVLLDSSQKVRVWQKLPIMSWSSRRRGTYLIIFALLVAVFLGVPTYFATHESPTCFDEIHNGEEEGIDCGGRCEKVCRFQAVNPIVKWSRLFEVAPGVYSVVAMIENPNFSVEAFNVPYVFKLRDEVSILVKEKKGFLYIPPKDLFPVFLSGINTGSREPSRVFFEFLKEPEWVTAPTRSSMIRIPSRDLAEFEGGTRLEVVVFNEGLEPVEDMEIVALLSDINSNVIAASKTSVNFLSGEEEIDVVFTWSDPFIESAVKIDLFPLISP